MNTHMFKHHQLLRVHTALEEAWGGAGYGAFNPSSWETETIRCLQSKPACSMEGVSSQSEIHSKTLSQNKNSQVVFKFRKECGQAHLGVSK